MQRKIRSFVPAAVGCLMLLLAASASAATFTGVAVHRNARAHSFTIALQNGGLRAIHSTRAPALGRRVTVTARLLKNGTWGLQRVRVGQKTKHVRIRGTVTYVDARHHTFVVSARGVSLLVHRRVRTGHPGHASDGGVAPGQVVTVNGSVDGNSVDADQVQSSGVNANGIGLEGTITAVNLTGRTLTISADDSEQSGGTLTIEVPASFDITLFKVGDAVELIVSPNGDGTYTLEQSSNDNTAQHANNQGEDQGDGNGDQHANAAQLCQAQQSDPNFAASHNGETFVQFWQTDSSNPNDAFGNCVDATAHGTTANPSPELQCRLEASDPNFAASHNGQTFAQFYNPQEPSNLGDAFGRCVDTKAQQQGHDSGQGGSPSGPGGSDNGSPSGPGSGN